MTYQDGTEARTRRRSWLRATLAAGGAGLIALAIGACGDDSDSSEGGGSVDEMTWAIPGDIVSLDPPFNYDYTTSTVDSQICEPLLKVDADGQLSPNLAEDWSQPDDTTYVYTLREGVKFHDGSELTPEDVKFSIERHLDGKLGSYLAQFHERVDSVDVTGPNEVTVNLSEPDATWKYAAANQSSSIVSKAFVEQNGDDTGAVGQPKTGVVCTGPYQFDSWTPGQSIQLTAFADYWDGEPKVGAIDFRVVEDEQTLVSGLNSGEIDGTIQQISGQAAQQLDSSQVNLLEGSSVNVAFLAFNTQRPPFDDVRVRQAMSYALDKQGIVDSVYAGYAQESKSPAPPDLWTYSEETWQTAYDELPDYAQDIDQATQLIQQAGADGASADLVYTGDVDAQTAIAVQDAASQIGLKITPRKLPPAQLTALQYADGPKDYDSTLLTWGSDFPDPIGNLNYPFNSGLPVTNVVEYANPEVDRLLDEARGTVDDEGRADLLQQAQAIIVEEQPWAVYAWPDVLMPLNSRLATDYEPNGFWYFQSWSDEISGA
jgi:peptide/nickel transport system substrate-binding protein